MHPEPHNPDDTTTRFAGLRSSIRRRASRLVDRRYQGKMDASDLVQLTLLKAHEHDSQCRRRDHRQLLAWLHAILTSTWIDQVRQFRGPTRDIGRERSLEDRPEGSDESGRLGNRLPAAEPSPSRVAIRKEETARLVQMVRQLPEDQLTAITLRHLRGEPIRAIAEMMQRSEAAVGGLLRRGMKRLRELMDTSDWR